MPCISVLYDNLSFEISIELRLLKSGTSIGANIREAQSAESKADFIHKFKIADKEIKETIYWLDICKFSEGIDSPPDQMLKSIKDIENIASKIIISSKRK